jgi:hypothetical protein
MSHREFVPVSMKETTHERPAANDSTKEEPESLI